MSVNLDPPAWVLRLGRRAKWAGEIAEAVLPAVLVVLSGLLGLIMLAFLWSILSWLK